MASGYAGISIMWYIYKITNSVNGKVYIGQTVNIKARWSRHKSNVKYYSKNSNKHLISAMIKYGINNFIFEVIDRVDTLEQADKLEIELIKKYDLTNPKFGYNKSPGGQGNRPMSEETRRKLSDSLKGRKSHMKGKHHSEETKKKLSDASRGNQYRVGVKASDETKHLLSKINTGKSQSQETRAKKSRSMIGKNAGVKNGMYGERSSHAKFTKEQANDIRKEYKETNISMLKLSRKYNVSKRAIFNIIHERTYI